VGDRFGLSWAVSGLGFAALQQGEVPRAKSLFQETLGLGRAVGNPSVTILYLTGMAGVVAQASLSQSSEQRKAALMRVARLFGGADRIRAGLRSELWQVIRLLYEQMLKTARLQLEDAAWLAAFAEGQAMSVEQVLAYASSDEGQG
jgi:hypothetical protein